MAHDALGRSGEPFDVVGAAAQELVGLLLHAARVTAAANPKSVELFG